MNIPLDEKWWGKARHAFDSPHCAVSILYTELGGYCSRHFHKHRVNRFLVISGSLDVVTYSGNLEETRERLGPGDVMDIESNIVHRFEVIEPGIVLEVYWPSSPGVSVRLDDIERLDIGGKR